MGINHYVSNGGGGFMLKTIIWFISVLVIVPIIYTVENYIRSLLPGHNRSYMLQPIYGLLKLFRKRAQKNTLTRWFSAAALWFSLLALYFTVAGENILLVLSCITMMEFFLVAGASNTSENFSRMAAQREITRFSVCFFAGIISAASIYQVAGTLNLHEISVYSMNSYILARLPLTFIAFGTVLLIRGSLICFDFGITGKEKSFFASGLYSPYSGWCLAIAQITQWIETGVLIKLMSVFLPWTPWISFFAIAICYLIILLLDSFVSKPKWKEASRNAWMLAGGMSAINFIWLYL